MQEYLMKSVFWLAVLTILASIGCDDEAAQPRAVPHHVAVPPRALPPRAVPHHVAVPPRGAPNRLVVPPRIALIVRVFPPRITVPAPVALVIRVYEVGSDAEQRFENIVDAVANPSLSEQVQFRIISREIVGFLPAQVPFIGPELETCTVYLLEEHSHELFEAYLEVAGWFNE